MHSEREVGLPGRLLNCLDYLASSHKYFLCCSICGATFRSPVDDAVSDLAVLRVLCVTGTFDWMSVITY